MATAKSFALTLSLSIFVLLPFFSCSVNLNSSSGLRSAYDELRASGFPVGLLPLGVLRHALNRTTGDFSVDFGGEACRVTLPPDNYLAAYSGKVTGTLREGRIAGLEGIRVRAFFRWWSITGIRVSGDDLVFEVGAVSAKYPTRNFAISPACENLQVKAAAA